MTTADSWDRTPLRYVLILLLAVVMATGVVACGNNDSPNSGSGATTQATGGSDGTRTVVDGQGRSVTIPANVTRVATSFPALPSAIYLLGAIDKLVAANSIGISDFLKTVDPAVKNIPTDAFPTPVEVKAEALLAERPQVVFTSKFQAALLPTFERLGIPVVVLSGPEDRNTPQSIGKQMTLMGEVLGGGAVQRATQWNAFFTSNVTEISAKTSSLPEAKRPTVFYATLGTTMTDPQAAWIEPAGGRNLSAENGVTQGKGFAFPEITTEALLKWNPDVIIAYADAAKRFKSEAQFRGLAAVRNDRVYAVPSGIWTWSTGITEQPLMPLWAAKTLHPELFADLDLSSKVKEFYSQLYNYELSDDQVKQILSGDLDL